MADLKALRRRISAHPASSGGPADEGYWLDLLEFELATSGSYELMVKRLAGLCEQQPEKLAAYIEASERGRLHWDVLHALVQRLQAKEKDVPPSLTKWWLDATTGNRNKPKQGGRTRHRNAMRDAMIVAAVNGIRNVTDLPYEFDERKSGEPRSACHVVAERLGMRYATVRTIWRNNRPLVERLRELKLLPPERKRTRRPC